MHRSNRRNLTLVRSVIVAGMLASSVTFDRPHAIADDAAKPAKKDTAAGLKPTQATLTASVEPAEAKPGDTVSFKVTAKLDAGFHIYKYSTENGDEAEVPTSFDFFDRAGLETEGEWKASAIPRNTRTLIFPTSRGGRIL